MNLWWELECFYWNYPVCVSGRKDSRLTSWSGFNQSSSLWDNIRPKGFLSWWFQGKVLFKSDTSPWVWEDGWEEICCTHGRCRKFQGRVTGRRWTSGLSGWGNRHIYWTTEVHFGEIRHSHLPKWGCNMLTLMELQRSHRSMSHPPFKQTFHSPRESSCSGQRAITH